MNNYYTYAYLREDGTPYYIGKGKKYRINNRGKNDIKPPKDKSKVIFLKRNLTEEEAFKHEIYMIAVFGRKDLGTGILRNRTNGGEGSSGVVVNEETKRKISESNKGRKWSKKSLERMGEIRKELHKNGIGTFANLTQEQRERAARKAKETNRKNGTGCYALSKEERVKRGKENYHKTLGRFNSEELSEFAKKTYELKIGVHSLTSEEKSQIAKKVNCQKWRCLVTGHITNPGALSKYQKSKGIDTSLRERLE